MATNYSSLWSALLSTALISGAPNVILFLFPNYAATGGEGSLILSMGQALAAGGLLGDVFLHSHSHGGDEDGHDHSDSDGIWLLIGFTFFLFMDMMLRSLEHSHDHNHNNHHKEEEKKDKKTTQLWTSPTVLNLLGDALHNLTDGLAIGASYGAGASSGGGGGWIATISILLHEIPHELGDYCLLLQNGFTKWQAIGLQFVTAVAAFCGTGLGWYLASNPASAWNIDSLTKGGFVYLATVTILPQGVLTQQPPSKKVFLWRCGQFLAFVAGLACLYAVAMLEEHDPDHAGHSHGHHDHVDDRSHDHGHHHSSSHDHHDHGHHEL